MNSASQTESGARVESIRLADGQRVFRVLDPLTETRSGQLKEIRELIEKNLEAIKNKWNEHVDRHRKAQG